MKYSRIYLGGISMFYRECGSSEKPVMLLLHGFPSASHQFRNLMPRLEANFHCIAPDYPGFGQSDAPGRESFTYMKQTKMSLASCGRTLRALLSLASPDHMIHLNGNKFLGPR